MSNYHEQSVRILIDKESELWAKLVARAAKNGTTVEDIVDMLLKLGSYHDLERKLDMMDRMVEGSK